MRWNPNVDTGTILIILTISGSAVSLYAAASSWATKQDMRVTQVEKDREADRDSTKQQLTEIKVDIKELGKKVDDVNTGLALLRGRAAETGGAKR